MREGSELIQATREFAVDDRSKSWMHVATTILLLLAALAGTVWNVHWTGQVVCSLLAGLLNVRTFILYHDHQHGAILRNSKAAEALFTVFGWYLLTPPSIWKRSHNFHHKHNAKILGASIGSYPVMTVDQWAQATSKQRAIYRFARHPLTILFGYFTVFLFGMCVKSYRKDRVRHRDSLGALIVHAGLFVGAAFHSWQMVVLTLVLPMAIAQFLGAYLFFAQHNFPEVRLKDRREWTYTDAALTASSYFRMSRVMHWFTGYIGFHHVHHLNARIPFYRLEEAMEAIPELQSPGVTSWRLKDINACLRLALWDAEQQRMVRWDAVST